MVKSEGKEIKREKSKSFFGLFFGGDFFCFLKLCVVWNTCFFFKSRFFACIHLFFGGKNNEMQSMPLDPRQSLRHVPMRELRDSHSNSRGALDLEVG